MSEKVTYRTQGVECETYLNWFRLEGGGILESEFANNAETARTLKNSRENIGMKMVIKYF